MDEWEQFQDAIPNFEDTSLISNSLLEHMNMTKDKSDYLWYTARLVTNPLILLASPKISCIPHCFLFTLLMIYHKTRNQLITKLVNLVNRFEHDFRCSEPILHVQSAAHVVHAFADGTYIGKS